MITRHSPRAHLLVLLCMLSFAAAILAATAYAGQDFYCNGCTLSSSGVPATSGSTNHIANGMQLAVAADWHHYQLTLTRLRGHLILGVSLEEGGSCGSSCEVSA